MIKDNHDNGLGKLRVLKTQIANNKSKVSEEDVRQAINYEIENKIHSEYKKKIIFNSEKKAFNSSRRIDSAYGNFIIEYKKPSVKLEDKEIEQIVDYLEDFSSKGKAEEIWGILTNGIDIICLEYNKNFNTFEINENKSGKLNDDKIEEIARELAEIKKITLTINTINDYLGIENNLDNQSILKILYKRIINSKKSRTLLLYYEWERLMRLSSDKDSWNTDKGKNKQINEFYEKIFNIKINNNKTQYKCLFVIQTYYAIVVKLVLYKYLKKKFKEPFNEFDFTNLLFKEIESTAFYKDHNILNLIDGDFFSWYIDELSENEFKSIYGLIDNIETIETNKLNETLITFYENIFPFQVRYAMGEYYTPSYLAEEVVDTALKIIKKQNIKSVLDPTCGSGIFLLQIVNSTYKDIVNLYGIDINPLAVLTAKASLILNDINLKKPTEIPIYLGDSTYSPKEEAIKGVHCYTYDYLTFIGSLKIKVTLPISLIKEINFFEILDTIEASIKHKNKKQAINIIESYKSSHYKQLKEQYNELVDQLLDLEKQELNSIWLKIIGNYFKAASIKDVDLIVGNPPWVSWKNLPTNYKNEIIKKCKIDGLFSNDKNTGGVDLNIAALIAFVCIRDRLNEKGILGFLMPDSILNNKSFEGFRKMQIDSKQFYLQEVVRWNGKEKPFYPVSIKFGEFFFSYKKNKHTKVYDRKQRKSYYMIQMTSSFNNQFVEESLFNNKYIGKNKLQFRKGIGLIKGGWYLLKFIKKTSKNTAYFRHFEKNGGSLQLSKEIIELETDIVYPFVKTEMINNNIITKSDFYCLFPYPSNSKEPYTLNEIREKYPKFYNYFNRSLIQENLNTSSTYNQRVQNVKNNVGIFRVGLYTYGKNFLAFRDNTKAAVAKVSYIKTDWGEKKMPLFDGHVTFLSQNEKGEFLSTIEQDKLFKIFTTKEVQDYIISSADERSISSRLWNDVKIY